MKSFGMTGLSGSKASPARKHEEVGLYEDNWWEFRFDGKQPDRRGYHSSFTHDH
jgi:hypothetical protein